MQKVLEQYEEHSLFARETWEKDTDSLPQTSDDAVQMIQGQLHYILHDPLISRARRMLVIEQFQNPDLAKLQTKQIAGVSIDHSFLASKKELMGYGYQVVKISLNEQTVLFQKSV